jgi:hypothetical protein
MSSGNWAEISPDGTWRYALHRLWGNGPVLGWIMLNPSTADAVLNDQTIVKIMHISAREGYDGAWVANLFAYRSPSPSILANLVGVDLAHAIGPLTDVWLRTMLAAVPGVVVAWGAHGGQSWAVPRRDEVRAMIEEYGVTVTCLGRTAGGEPKHPCRLANATPLEAWAP